MFRTLALSATILALSAGLALAGGPATTEPSSGRPTATQASSLSGPQWLASDVYKAKVYDNSENKIGDVNDLVVNKNDGTISAAIIGVGGFLGIGEKDVAIPFKDLNVSSREDKDWLVLSQTKDQLKAAPAYEPKEQRSAAPPSSLSATDWLMSDIYKADVYNNSEQKIGKITDVVMDRSGKISTVAIDVGGFLGVGKKKVAIPFSDLKVASREGKDWLVLDQTKDDLMKAPAFAEPEGKKM